MAIDSHQVICCSLSLRLRKIFLNCVIGLLAIDRQFELLVGVFAAPLFNCIQKNADTRSDIFLSCLVVQTKSWHIVLRMDMPIWIFGTLDANVLNLKRPTLKFFSYLINVQENCNELFCVFIARVFSESGKSNISIRRLLTLP